jgi:outer membrane protein assembly factor BamA
VLGQYTATRGGSRTLVSETRPYGSGEFGEVGATAGVVVDRRDSPIAPSRGFRLAVDASLHPALWDVASTFGNAQVVASTYLSAKAPLSPTLAIRAGGRHTWGAFPFHDAAFLGGSTTLRGWEEQRFAGRSSLFGSTELRLRLRKAFIVVPADLGLLTFVDAGRVFADGSESSVWHSGFGGGIWLAPLTRGNTVSVSVARSRERLGVYVASGFAF